jgi:hypothetical protein
VSKFKKGDLVCVYTDPVACGIVTKISPQGALVWVHWFETKKTTDVYAEILLPLDHLTFA